MTQCHVPEDLNPKILVSCLRCAALQFGKKRVMKRWPQPATKLHGATHQNMALFIVTAAKTHNFIENGGKLSFWGEKQETLWCMNKDKALISCSNLMHHLFIIFINFLYMFREILCSSSGGFIVYIEHLVLCMSLFLGDIQRTRCSMYTMNPPDDEHNIA